jgi:outer membrane protein TolC
MSRFRAAAPGRSIDFIRRVAPALLAGLLVTGVAARAEPGPAGPDLTAGAGLPELIAYAEAHNPQLAASLQRWRAAERRVPQAEALPDPQLGVGLVLDQVDADPEYMGERYSLSQSLPWFGTRSLRGEVAAREAGADGRRHEALRLALAEQVTAAWLDYAWVHQAVETARANRELVLRLEGVARARYRAGLGNQADVSRAQVELGRLDDRLRSLLDALAPAAARLNALLGRPAHLRLPPPAAPSLQPLEPLREQDFAAWLERVRAANPRIGLARELIERERHAVELARKAYYPDVRLGVEYGRDTGARMAAMDGGGADMLVGMISISLPIRQGRYDAGLDEAQARFQAAGRDVRASELAVEAELQTALFEYREGERKLQLYRGTLVPRARHAFEATEAAYRAGDAGFTDLIDAQRTWLEFELAQERAAADRGIAAARVRALAGEPAAGPTPEEQP